jgi:tripartite-type tricarboxylate transporter receptor subunit TctC
MTTRLRRSPISARRSRGNRQDGSRDAAPGWSAGTRLMKSSVSHLTAAIAVGVGLSLAASLGAAGAGPDDFYKGKQLRLILGFPAGNDYDLGARLLVKYLTRYIPGQPAIIVQNMPQAASIAAANYLYAQAPRDGSVFGSFSRNVVNDALTAQPNVQVDPRRFNWLGATSLPSRVCVRWFTAPVKTPADLFTQDFIVGAAGATSSLAILPTVLNHVLGTRFRIVEGYQGLGDAMLAVERGELQGVCASYGQFRVNEQLIRDGKLIFLLRAEEAPIADIPDVPSIFDFAQTDEQRQLMRFVFSSTEFGRPYVFPPDVAKDRVGIMREAIAGAARDPDLLAEAAGIKMDMTYTPPEHLERLIAQLYQTPPALIGTIKSLLPNVK